MRVVAPE